MGSGLGDGCTAVRLTRPPSMIRVAQPSAGPSFATAVADVRARMAAGDGFFDGEIAVPVAVHGHEVRYHPATYAWHLAEREGAALPAGRGLVAVALLLQRPDGRVLWQRRAPHLTFGGTWDVSAAGSWHPAEDPIEAAYREGVEELGVGRERLGVTAEAWMVVGPAPRGVTFVVRAHVDPPPPVRPDPGEVDRVMWAHTPEELPGAVWSPRRQMLDEIGFP